jgi:hypothetical protein
MMDPDMPIEAWFLKGEPEPFDFCPACGAEPFECFMRGTVQRSRRQWLGLGPRQPYCAVICSECKVVLGYENPPESDKIDENRP